MRAHRRGGALLVAAHDRDDDAVVLGLGLGETAEIAELGAAERLHTDARRQRDLSDVAVLRSRIDRVVAMAIASSLPRRSPSGVAPIRIAQ